MTILYFISHINCDGGIQRIVIDKANYLAQLPDYEIHLAYYGKNQDVSYYPISKKVRLWAIEAPTKHTPIKELMSLMHIYRETSRLIDTVKPNIMVNAHSKIIYFFPFIYNRIPKIVEIHQTYDGLQLLNEQIYGKNSVKFFINGALRRYFSSRFDKCVVLVTDDLKAWGFKNMTVIPNFTNMIFKPSPNQKEKVVINVGRLEEQKDHQKLIETWKIVNAIHPDWKLEIWGSGSLKEKLRLQIEQSGLTDSVLLKGVTHHIEKEYQRAAILALSSKYEGMPLVAIEAMTAGVPCVSFDIAGIGDVISDGEDGIVVKQHTPQALADGINVLIENEQLRTDMSKKSVLKVGRFDKNTVMRKWIKLFESVSSR